MKSGKLFYSNTIIAYFTVSSFPLLSQDKLITVSSRTNILRAMEVMTGNESFNYFVKRVDCIKFVSYWKT